MDLELFANLYARAGRSSWSHDQFPDPPTPPYQAIIAARSNTRRRPFPPTNQSVRNITVRTQCLDHSRLTSIMLPMRRDTFKHERHLFLAHFHPDRPDSVALCPELVWVIFRMASGSVPMTADGTVDFGWRFTCSEHRSESRLLLVSLLSAGRHSPLAAATADVKSCSLMDLLAQFIGESTHQGGGSGFENTTSATFWPATRSPGLMKRFRWRRSRS